MTGGVHKALRILASLPVVAAISVAGFVILFAAENYIDSVPFVGFVAVSLCLVFFLLTRRIALSAYAAWTLMAMMTAISLVKHLLTGSGLHVYDIAFVAGDASMPEFLLKFYPHYALPLLLAGACALALLVALAIVERPRPLGVVSRGGLLSVAMLGAVASFPAEAHSHLYYLRGSHASNFVVSLRDLVSFWMPNPLVARLERLPAQGTYARQVECGPADERPDVIFLHGESFLPPSFVPAWDVEDRAVGDFTSHDGTTRSMGVETYGGGSWLTVMSVLSGLSGADFEWMRPYLVKALTGRVEHAVPQLLKQCGYRTAGVMATKRNFADLGPFLESIGVDEIADMEDTRSPSLQVRDSHHLTAGLALIRSKRAAGDAPTFLFLETLFAHSPYDERIEPDVVLAGEPFTADAEVDEFLRRLAMSRQDVEAFYASLERDPGPRGTIVVEYGDHQPFVTTFPDEPAGDESEWSSPKFATFFAVRAFGPAEAPPMPQHARMDAAFLGHWLLDAAGLVKGGLTQDMGRLAERCEGYFHLCAARDDVDRMLRRRMDSGLLDLSGRQFGAS